MKPMPALLLLAVAFCTNAADTLPRDYSIPLIDLSGEKHRQVVVDREAGQYLGHPTTVLLEDNKTMLCVYPKGHGKGGIVYKRSTDGGLTWSERLPTPASWATSREVPTLHRVIGPDGKKRIIMWSGLYPARLAVTEDDGATWSELKAVGDWGGIVVMGFTEPIKTGAGHYLAMFHDDGRYFSAKNEQKKPVEFRLYKTLSRDGGLTWSFPEVVQRSSDVHLCEPGLIRSPDGKQLAVLLRENSRRKNSHVIFSDDEGANWTAPREVPGALTGDRHTGRYASDGRLFISFRDTTLKSATRGDWVAWVGTYDDIVNSREGQYRVRLMDNTKTYDCAYPGVELLPDGTFVTTTYGHWATNESPYIISVRLKLDELDVKAGKASPKKTAAAPGSTTFPTEKAPWKTGTHDEARTALRTEIESVIKLPAYQIEAHPAAADFPGAVPAETKTVTRTVAVDTSVPLWHSTGLYASPGAKITVTIPPGLAEKKLLVRIGAHKDRNWRLDSWKRVPEITRTASLTQERTDVANPFGGSVYLEVPEGLAAGRVNVTIARGVPAPWFKLGATSLEEWRQTIRHHPAPWAEIEGEFLTITLPSASVRQLDDPDAVAVFWDKVQRANAKLAALPAPRRDRFVLDRQIVAGYMHAGYPIMAWLDQRDKVANMNELKKGNWGFFHELGHNHQVRDWTFSGTGEVTCNLFSMHSFEQVLGLPKESHNSMKDAAREAGMIQYFSGGKGFEDWKKKPFLALTMYHQLLGAFGWESFTKVFAEYLALPADERPKSDDARRDQWLVRYARTVGKNLGPFFDAWKLPVSDAAKEKVTSLPVWLPEPDFPARYRK